MINTSQHFTSSKYNVSATNSISCQTKYAKDNIHLRECYQVRNYIKVSPLICDIDQKYLCFLLRLSPMPTYMHLVYLNTRLTPILNYLISFILSLPGLSFVCFIQVPQYKQIPCTFKEAKTHTLNICMGLNSLYGIYINRLSVTTSFHPFFFFPYYLLVMGVSLYIRGFSYLLLLCLQ